MSETAITEVENLAIVLIQGAIKKYGKNIPSSDPDYCEVFGLLRGAVCTQGKRKGDAIRIAPGYGEPTHANIRAWYLELRDRAVADNVRKAVTKSNA
jgi:hypothetical protein